jgi:lysophospholipase L1-like esterase
MSPDNVPTPIGSSKPRLAKRLSVSLVAAILCCGLLEVAFRVAGYKAIYETYSRPEMFWRKDALLGWSHQPNSHGIYVGPRPFPVEFQGSVHINSLGIRGSEISELPRDADRILVLGDSVVAGFEVDDDKTFETILARDLTVDLGRPVDVVNAGVRGYGTDQSLLYYRERGRSLHPDLVVFVASDNDLEDNTTLHRARRPFGKPAFALKTDGSVELTGTPVPDYPFCSGVRLDADFKPIRIDSPARRAMCWLQVNLSDHSALFTFATLRIQQNPALLRKLFSVATPEGQATIMKVPGEPAAVTPAGRLTTALIRKMAQTARDDGARFLLAIYDYDLAMLDGRQLYEDGVAHFLLNAANPTTPGERLTWINDSHMNEAGHRRVAEVLRPVLAEQLRAIAAQRGMTGP